MRETWQVCYSHLYLSPFRPVYVMLRMLQPDYKRAVTNDGFHGARKLVYMSFAVENTKVESCIFKWETPKKFALQLTRFD